MARKVDNVIFKIMWGDEIGVQDEESWYDAIKGSDSIKSSGSWCSLVYEDGTEEKFQPSRWSEKIVNEKFRARVLELIDREVILKFDKREGTAADFYEEE